MTGKKSIPFVISDVPKTHESLLSGPASPGIIAEGGPVKQKLTVVPAQHVRPSGFFCRWSDGLELTARRHAGSGVFCLQLQYYRQLLKTFLFSQY